MKAISTNKSFRLGTWINGFKARPLSRRKKLLRRPAFVDLRAIRPVLLAAVPFFASIIASPTHAALVAPAIFGVGAVSLTPAAAVTVAGGAALTAGVTYSSWWGKIAGGLVALGGATVFVTDPPQGIFYDGSFSIHYPADLMHITGWGWLGDWGADPSLAAPPVDPLEWGNGLIFQLQAPNPGLTATVTNDPGLLTATFDWGPGGHAVADDHFNFFSAVAEATSNLTFSFLGDSAEPLPGANVFVTTSGLHCTPPGSDMLVNCGDQTTGNWHVETPEPSTYALLLSAISLLGFAAHRRKRMSSHSSFLQRSGS